MAGRDDVAGLPDRPEWAGFSEVQRQLLGGAGDGSGDHAWGTSRRPPRCTAN